MEWSEILNVIFGTGLVATIVGLLSIRSELKKARAEAEKAMAEADTVKITNTENATRILIENIVEPLREELDATRRDLNATKREMARFRKAVEAIPLCPYHAGCPVLDELQDVADSGFPRKDGQHQEHIVGGNRKPKRHRASPLRHSGRAANHTGANRQSASGCRVQCTDVSGEGFAEETSQRGDDFVRPGHQPGEGDDHDEGEV